MIRPVMLGSLVLVAVLPGLLDAARADGAPGAARRLHPPRVHAHGSALRPVRHAAHHRRFGPHRFGAGYDPFGPGAGGIVYGDLPRNLNLPIYNAPSEGPAPTL